MANSPVYFIRVAFAAIMLVCMFSIDYSLAQGIENEADAEASRSVVEDQLEAFKARDLDRAYSHAAPGIRAMFPSVEQFSAMVERGYGAIFKNETYVFGRNRQDAQDMFHEVIITDETGKQWQAVYSLRRQEDGSWRITGVKMNPYKGGSA